MTTGCCSETSRPGSNGSAEPTPGLAPTSCSTALQRNDYERRLAGQPDARHRLADVRKLMRPARQWQEHLGSDLRGFLDHLRSLADAAAGARESEAPVESEALEAVRLMTIHRSKGLEFPVVCVADLAVRCCTRWCRGARGP